MRLRFRPVDSTFYTLFTALAQRLVTGAELLNDLFAEDPARESVARRMREEEHLADEATHEIVRRANRTFVTPIDREDIYALASALDDVMDHMEEAADLVLLYDLRTLPAGLADQARTIQRCAEVTAEAMPRLQTMKDLDEYWIEVNRLENAGDKEYRALLAQLFGGEYEALEVLKLKDVVDSLEAAIDAFETVANIVEQISVKES